MEMEVEMFNAGNSSLQDTKKSVTCSDTGLGTRDKHWKGNLYCSPFLPEVYKKHLAQYQ